MAYLERPLRISYSSLKQYESCPQQYKWQRLDKKPVPVQESRHHALMGTVIQQTFETFYKNEIWRLRENASAYLKDVAADHLANFLSHNKVDWNSPTCNFTLADVTDELNRIIPAMVKTIAREKLLGPYAQSEVSVEVFLDKDIILGNIDFLIVTSDDQVLILDGKATKKREKNVDPDQLHFYAMLYFMRYQVRPNKLGFIFYHFADDPEQVMMWHEVSDLKIQEMRDRVRAMVRAMVSNQFEPTPKPSFCQYCPWEQQCQDRMIQKQVNSAKHNKNRSRDKALPPPDNNGMIGF
jgi:predicted RecB family nuclease